jgi:hypothetical protein
MTHLKNLLFLSMTFIICGCKTSQVYESLMISSKIGLGIFARKLKARRGAGIAIKATARKIAEGIRAANPSLSGDLKADLMLIGKEISKFASSTFGTLFATGFIRASAVVSPENDALTNLQKSLQAAFDGI